MPSKDDLINTSPVSGARELLDRLVETIIPSRAEFEKAIFGREKLIVYHGVDPTAPSLHLGHSTNYLLLKKLQELGHKVTLLIGDFTARIGDPSGRTKERVPLSQEQIEKNFKLYKAQAGKILDFHSKTNPVQVSYNSAWLGKLFVGELLDISSHFTVQQMLARDMFQKRIQEENPIGFNEFLYPLLQGYDSVALKTDIEIGGSDQLFNMLVGRILVKTYLKKGKFVVTTKLLVNPNTGSKLMSKSEGGYVALDDRPSDMYGKVMALPDEVIKDCFELCTEAPMTEITEIMKLPPRDAKAKLALTITGMYHGESGAKKAENEFNKVFSGDDLPKDIPVVKVSGTTKNIVELLIEAGLAPSKSEARRLIEQGGVRIDSEAQTDNVKEVSIKEGMVLQVGKRRFVKLSLG